MDPQSDGRVLSPVAVLVLLLSLLGVLIPLCFWLGPVGLPILTDPASWMDAQWPGLVAGILAASLFTIPFLWVLVSRRLDLISLSLAQNALIICGYFFIGTTAYNIMWEGREMLRFVPLVLLFNAIGFLVLLLSLGGSYALAAGAGLRLPQLGAELEAFDQSLRLLLILLGIVAASVIGMPMAASGTIPLLAENPTEARFAIVESPSLRALYHMGTALLPFVVGGLIVGIARRPIRAFGIDGMLVLAIVCLQILTSNRLPLAITLVVTATLLGMERRIPRFVLAGAFAGYLVLFAGLSGFTALLRLGNEAQVKGNIVEASLQEAFLGDNLIDLRDAAWVFSHWDGQPLQGKTYLGGLVSLMPSGLFPQKKEWHLGITGVRIVGWDPEEHFGLRITYFGESFLNFGLPGVITLGVVLGAAYGILLRSLHLAGKADRQCLARNVKIVMLMQMLLPFSNTSDAFTSWSMLAMFLTIVFFVDLPARWLAKPVNLRLPAPHAPRRA